MRPVVVILLHEPDDTPAYMKEYLTKRGIDFVTYECWQGAVADLLPCSVKDYVRCVRVDGAAYHHRPVPETCEAGEYCCVRGVVSFGGSVSVNDHLPYYESICRLMRSCIDTRTPVIGHCLGAQLLAVALGGVVRAAENIEVGWMDLQVVGAAGAKDWFGGRQTINAFQIHTENFSIPAGAHRIVVGKHCANQAYQVGDQYALGMQFHPEVDEQKVRNLTAVDFPSLHTRAEIDAMDDAQLKRLSPAAATRDEIEACLREGRIEQNRPIADCIYDTWCSGFLV